MKKILALVFCLITLALCGCNVPSEQMAEEDIRKQIIADNICLNSADDAAGATWLASYLNVENAEMIESFRSGDMSDGFDLCFSKWSSGQREYIVSEVVYETGERYLCDLYELTGITKLHTLAYAYERVSVDERFAHAMTGIGSNAHSDGITEINVTSESSQTISYELLEEESIKAKQVLYGVPSDGVNYTVRIVATVDGTGLRNVYMCNDERPATVDGQYLINKSYYVCFSDSTGDFVVMDRQHNEVKLCDTVDTDDETRRMPSLYGVYDDRYAVYTISDNTGVVSVGVYDARMKINTVRASSGSPVGMYGDRLYLANDEADGNCTVAYLPLDDLNAEPMLFDALSGSIDNVAFSEQGSMAAVYSPVDGRTNIAIFDAISGEVLSEEYIDGIYCEPQYIGFLEDGSLMILCDKRLLCDEYLFIIGE